MVHTASLSELPWQDSMPTTATSAMLKHHGESGQVFTETSAPAIKISVFKWLNSSQGSDKGIKEFRTAGLGADSFVRMAMRSVVLNRHGIYKENLKDVPWEPVGKMIWTELSKQ